MTIFRKASLLLTLVLLLTTHSSSFGKELSNNPYLVIDASDGSIISANHEFDRWYPASLTKLMTAYVTMRAIKDGEIETGSPVRISGKSAKTPASRMNYKIGTVLRTDVALKILIVKSANDVAIALAESVAGSVKEFVTRMNRTAALLGLKQTNFVNPNGLHSPGQYTSAQDLAILARRILLDFPQYSQWFAIPSIRSNEKTHYSYNLLLERFAGANGMKTGFICASGYNMVATAKRGDRQLVAVILGANSQSDRAVLAARLLSQAFARPELLIGNILGFNTKPVKAGTAARPKNMRPVLCTEEARKNRYEPGAGKAEISSEYLLAREIIRQPVLIKTGGVDGDPSKAYAALVKTPVVQIPVPLKRPISVLAAPIDGQAKVDTENQAAIPVPLRRPDD